MSLHDGRATTPSDPPRHTSVYILVCTDPFFSPHRDGKRVRYYTGMTDDLQARIERHNAGEVAATRGRIWQYYCYMTGLTRSEAAAIEKHLKTGDTVEKRRRFALACEANKRGELHGSCYYTSIRGDRADER